MLKDYFIRLFNYDEYTNKQITGLILIAANAEKPTVLMAHLLNAQQIWLSRCLGRSSSNYKLWPDWQAHAFNDIIANNHREWIDFLDTEIDPERVIKYKNLKGEEFSSKLFDILAHVINHGTHHRAQIGMHLKQSEGTELPSTDYVHYIRGLQ